MTRADATFPRVRDRHVVLTRDALAAVFENQGFHVANRGRLGAEWDGKLAAVVLERNMATATDIGGRVAKRLGGEFDPSNMEEWFTNNARIAAEGINGSTRDAVAAADNGDAKTAVFEALVVTGAVSHARSMVTGAANFGAHDAAGASGAKTKTWVHSGLGPRHSDLSGETVPIDGAFSNGMNVPGDPTGGAENVANCGCTVAFNL